MAYECPHYFTAVVYFPDGKGQQDFVTYLHNNFPMMAESGPRATMLGYGDCVSISDAARMALECSAHGVDQKELALELLEASDWGDCLRIFSDWDLVLKDGALVDGAHAKEPAT